MESHSAIRKNAGSRSVSGSTLNQCSSTTLLWPPICNGIPSVAYGTWNFNGLLCRALDAAGMAGVLPVVLPHHRLDGQGMPENMFFTLVCSPARNIILKGMSRGMDWADVDISVGDPWHFCADPYLWLKDPAPTPFFSDFSDAKNYFFFVTIFS